MRSAGMGSWRPRHRPLLRRIAAHVLPIVACQRSVPARPALLLLILSLAPACWPASLAAQGVEYVKANYTKYEFRIPMRDGARLFTAVYVPKDRSQTYPILLSRTPYSVQPYGVDAYRADLGPSPLFGSEGYIVAYQDVRGRWMSEGEFVNMRPHKDVKNGPAGHRREHRHLRHHRLADQEHSQPQWQGGHVGNLLSRLLHRGGNDRRPPGTQGSLAPGSHRRLVCRRRLAPQRRPVLAPCLRLPRILRASASRADQEGTARAVRLRHTRRLHLLPPVGTAVERQQEVLQGRCSVLERDDAARELRRFLDRAESSTAPQEHSTGRADGGRLVRRREPVRGARDLQERGGLQPRHHQRPGDGPLAPWRLGARRRFLAWPGPVLHEHRRALS